VSTIKINDTRHRPARGLRSREWRGIHENPAGKVAVMLWGFHGDGNKCRGTPAGTEQNVVVGMSLYLTFVGAPI